MARALLEGCAFAMRDVADRLKELGAEIRSLLLLGGGARSRLWAQIRADLLGLPTEISSRVDSSPVGAAMLAAVAAGLIGNLHQAAGMVPGTRGPAGAGGIDPRRLWRGLWPLSPPVRQSAAAVRAGKTGAAAAERNPRWQGGQHPLSDNMIYQLAGGDPARPRWGRPLAGRDPLGRHPADVEECRGRLRQAARAWEASGRRQRLDDPRRCSAPASCGRWKASDRSPASCCPASPIPMARPSRRSARRSASADALVAVGSGTINDLCKYASAQDRKPYIVYAAPRRR